jgi:4,5-DOPA dioxygenase extradiol
MTLHELDRLTQSFDSTDPMPLLFVGHGNPMNAIEENEFVAGFRSVAATLPRPRAVLCISAHWETQGTLVTAMQHPRTIHDFGGFPHELYEVQYPAPGSPELARETNRLIHQTEVGLDESWGLDHGAWSVLRHFYPEADVPIIEMSLDYTKDARWHYDLARQLASLRRKGVLLMGSGNMVHNLRMIAWRRAEETFAYDWALEAGDKMKQLILSGDDGGLIDYQRQGEAFHLAIPTPEHYLPLLYPLALRESNEEVSLFNDSPVGGSITMTSVLITPAQIR